MLSSRILSAIASTTPEHTRSKTSKIIGGRKKESRMPWRPLPRIAFAVAIYPFQPSSPADLPLELGDELYIIEQGGANGSWYRGYLVAPPSLLAGLTSVKGQTLEARVFSGIFPANCVEIREYLGETEGKKVLENGQRTSTLTNGVNHAGDDDGSGRQSTAASPRPGSIPLTPLTVIAPRDPDAPKPPAPVPMLKIGDETPTSYEEPLVDEIASCLREWHSTNLHELLLSRRYGDLEKMAHIVQELDLARRQLLHNVLTAHEKEAVRQATVWNLVRGNKMLTGEVIVRDPKQRGRLLTADDSAIELSKLQSEMSMLDSDPNQQTDPNSIHHVLLEVKNVSGLSSGPMTLSIHLAAKAENGRLKRMSETFLLDIPSLEGFFCAANSTKLKTLFTELCAADLGDGTGSQTQLYLVIMVQTAAPPRTARLPAGRSGGSRDGSLASRGVATLNSVKGSVRARRSMYFRMLDSSIIGGDQSQSKSSRSGSQQQESGKETPRPRPSTSDSSSSRRSRTDSVSSSTQEVLVPRTVGVGLVDIAHIIRQHRDTELSLNVWSPVDEFQEEEEQEENNEAMDELVRSLLTSTSGRYARCRAAQRIQVHVYPFTNPDADALVRTNPTMMHNVTQTRRMGFPAAPSTPRSDIYLTISRPNLPYNGFLSHPQSGLVPIPTNTSLRNLQLTLEVRNSSGHRIDRCVFAASNLPGHTAWRTTATERDQAWDQTVRLKIPADQVADAHVIMSIADGPEFPFALCWLPLWDEQAFVQDGPHTLLLHAYDKVTSHVDEEGRGAYMDLPWSAVSRPPHGKGESVVGNHMATLQVETTLCSTEISQDQVILGLINWRNKPGDEVLELLRRLLFVSEIEIVKRLRDVFDALFDILVENAGSDDFEDLIFNALVTVLGIVYDRRFNLEPLVDHYIENQFDCPYATPSLMRSYLRLLTNGDSLQQSRQLRAAFKVGRHLLKFIIINAREQHKGKENGVVVRQIQPSFNRDLHAIFGSLETLMRNPSPAMVGTKTLVVQRFHTWLPELVGVLSNDEIIMIALSFMDACSDVKGLLVLYKLVLIQNYTRLEIFSSGAERNTLVSSCISWLDPYWGATNEVSDQYRDQVRLCASIVAELLKQPDPQLYAFMDKIVASYCAIALEGVEETNYLSMLYSKTFPFQVKSSERSQKFDEALVELAGLMAAISNIPEPKLPNLKHEDMATFLSNALEAYKSIISCEAFPEDWLSVHIYHHRATVKGLEHIASMLMQSFLPPPDDADRFDTKLWELFFVTLLKVVSSDALALETFPEQKRRAVWKIGGDVREQGAELLRQTWEAIGWEPSEEGKAKYGLKKLGGYQVQYVPNLVPAIIELCLSVHEGLRHVAVEVLRTMIISEWDLNQDLSIIQSEIVTSLDALFQTKQHMTEGVTQKLFINELLDLFEPIAEVDDALAADVKGLIATMDELLSLLVACHSGGITESLHRLRLMEFMKDMDREDIFIRYVHELAQSQAAERNYTEAGLALKFHADLYTWDTTRLVPALANPPFPEQTAFERKEALYFAMIQHFEDGKAWSHALACYKELAEQYEHAVIDFAKLSRAQGSMSRIYEAIVKEPKQFPRYFRVSYRGLGFPPTLRDKHFIFEASPNERMASFTDRMQKLHPAAQIVSGGEPEDLEGQYIQIGAVSPHRDVMHPVYQRSKVPHPVREHLLISQPTRFSFTSKRHTGNVDVREQWVEKTIYTTAEPFPNILRRSEIVSTEVVELSPLSTAIERTWRKTQELLLLEQRAISGQDSSLSNLTDALMQLLELGSAPTSCVALYRQFLINENETAEREEKDGQEEGEHQQEQEEEEDAEEKPMDPLENALAVALIDHALTIKHCLSLYSRPAHQATQAELTRRLEEAFGPELATLATLPPMTPSRSSSRGLGTSHRSTPLANGIRAGQTASSDGSLGPRTARSNSRRHITKPSIGRISIVNPFKRVNHIATGSIATTWTAGRHRAGSKATTTRPSMERQRSHDYCEDDAVTVHSRATSVSRTRSEKRRSWFGGGGERSGRTHQQHKPAASVASEDVAGGDTEQRQHFYTRARSATSRSAKSGKSQDENSYARQHQQTTTQRLETKKSTQALSDWGEGDTALPRTSNVNVTVDDRPTWDNPVAVHHPRPSEEYTQEPPQTQSQLQSHSHSINVGAVRDTVIKRFSQLKGTVGRKTSRLHMRDGMSRGGITEVVREE